MIKRISLRLKLLLAAAAFLGGGIGMSTSMGAQSWPNQCYNYDGGSSCPICGGSCLGGIYLCCNNGAGGGDADERGPFYQTP